MNQNNRPQNNWEPVNSGSNNPRWEPHKNPVFNENNPAWIEGYFISFKSRHHDQNGDFRVTEIATLNPDGTLGECVDVSGGGVLEGCMEEVNLNTYVRIEYHGKTASKSGGRTYNNWKVFQDHKIQPYNQRNDVMAMNAGKPHAQQNNTGKNTNQQQGQAQNNQGQNNQGFNQGQGQAFNQGQQTNQGHGGGQYNAGAGQQQNYNSGQGQGQQTNQGGGGQWQGGQGQQTNQPPQRAFDPNAVPGQQQNFNQGGQGQQNQNYNSGPGNSQDPPF